MSCPVFRHAVSVLIAAATLAAVPASGADAPPSPVGSGFSGAWALSASSDDVVAKPAKEGWDILGGAERPEGTGTLGAGGGFDLPLEVMTDAHRLVVADDGTTLRVTYPSGRKRAFVTDGAKRYLDDGDGPADVTAHRKGETVSVTSEWFRGYKLRETWELRANPRRLVVTGKVKGRNSYEYKRTYEPAPAVEPKAEKPEPVATAPAAAAAAATGSEATGRPAEWKPPAVNRLGECAIRPPRRATADDLGKLVRVTQEEAGKTAIASLAPMKPADTISSDVEVYEGCLTWPFTLRLPGMKGVQEIFVDAGDGKVVWSEFVPMDHPASETPAP